MSQSSRIFNAKAITPARDSTTSAESSIPLITSRFVDLSQITKDSFMSVSDSAFQKSKFFKDSPNLADLDFAKLARLASGDEQILVFSDDPTNLPNNRDHSAAASLVANGSFVLTINGYESVAINGNSSDIILGKSNQKIYNGAISFFDGPAFRAYDKLITTYEHASVMEESKHSDTVYHFGDLDVLRRGDENMTVHGQGIIQVFGSQEKTIHGNVISVSETFSLEKYDSVMTVKSVAGIKIETNAGLGIIALAGTETNINSIGMVVAISESLLSVLEGKFELLLMDAVSGLFGTEGIAAKAFGMCVRAGAAVFGIIRT